VYFWHQSVLTKVVILNRGGKEGFKDRSDCAFIFEFCDSRLQALEKRVFIENGDLPRSVGDIQLQVEEFKNKLQVRQVMSRNKNASKVI